MPGKCLLFTSALVQPKMKGYFVNYRVLLSTIIAALFMGCASGPVTIITDSRQQYAPYDSSSSVFYIVRPSKMTSSAVPTYYTYEVKNSEGSIVKSGMVGLKNGTYTYIISPPGEFTIWLGVTKYGIDFWSGKPDLTKTNPYFKTVLTKGGNSYWVDHEIESLTTIGMIVEAFDDLE